MLASPLYPRTPSAATLGNAPTIAIKTVLCSPSTLAERTIKTATGRLARRPYIRFAITAKAYEVEPKVSGSRKLFRGRIAYPSELDGTLKMMGKTFVIAPFFESPDALRDRFLEHRSGWATNGRE